MVQSPGFLNLPGWHLLAGDAVTNELHILPLRDYNINCLAILHYHGDPGSMPLAISAMQTQQIRASTISGIQ